MQLQRFTLREQAGILVTRRLGEKVRRNILSSLNRGTGPTSLLLDFSEIHILDYSCADELVSRMAIELNSGLYGEFFLLLTGLDDMLHENVAVALKQREVALMCDKEKQWHIIGSLRSYLEHGLLMLNRERVITSRELADAEGISINAACNRMNELCRQGLAYRNPAPPLSGGKLFQYISILPQQDAMAETAG